MLLRCLTSSESEEGSCECSAVHKAIMTSLKKIQQDKELKILWTKKEKVPGGLYKPDRSMEIAAEGGVGLTSVSSKCSIEVLLGDWAVDAGEEEHWRHHESEAEAPNTERRWVEAWSSNLLNISTILVDLDCWKLTLDRVCILYPLRELAVRKGKKIYWITFWIRST